MNIKGVSMFCFSGEMKVLLLGGTEKKIAECVVGESIFAIDKLTKKPKESIISDIIKAEANEVIIINGILEATASHVLYTHDFVPCTVGSLHVDDYVFNKDKELERITKLELKERKTKVYNLTLTGDDYFSAENFLVCSYHPIMGKNGEMLEDRIEKDFEIVIDLVTGEMKTVSKSQADQMVEQFPKVGTLAKLYID